MSSQARHALPRHGACAPHFPVIPSARSAAEESRTSALHPRTRSCGHGSLDSSATLGMTGGYARRRGGGPRGGSRGAGGPRGGRASGGGLAGGLGAPGSGAGGGRGNERGPPRGAGWPSLIIVSCCAVVAFVAPFVAPLLQRAGATGPLCGGATSA